MRDFRQLSFVGLLQESKGMPQETELSLQRWSRSSHNAFFVWRSSGTQDAGNCVKRVKAGDNARSTPSPQHDAMHTFKKPAHNEFIILATFATCRRRSVHVGFIMSLLALFRVSQTLSLGCNVISSPVDMQRRLPDADEC